MDYEWDAAKVLANRRKHAIDFADVVAVFDDPYAMSMPDASRDEPRFVSIGADILGRIVVVIYTYRGEKVRIISARRATRGERRNYEADMR